MNRPDTAHSEGPSAYQRAAELQLRDVSKRYPGQRTPAIASLSLDVPAGDVCVLVGPSGSGKTTTMRLINRLIPLDSGDILLGGQSVLRRDPRELRREIGYVIQNVGLFPHRTVGQNIATVPHLLGWPHERIDARVNELLALIDLDGDEMAERYPSQLSGGQRQRVGVARALAADPPLMLMDEPFGAIDPINRARLQDEFLRLQAQVRKTVVFVTHDIDEAIKMGDRIAILREGGELAQYDTPEQILAHPADEFVAEFVGADRALKRLTLYRVSQLALLPAGDSRDGAAPARTINADVSARAALSILLSGEQPALPVVGDDGSILGLVTVDVVHRFLATDGGGASNSDAGAPAGGTASHPRTKAPAGSKERP